MYGRGIPVSMPLPMLNGRLVESIALDNKYHTVCAFEKAEGEHCEKDNPNTWNRHVIEDWGYVLGGIHRETKDFQVSDPRFMHIEFDGRDIDGTDVLEKTFAKIPPIEKYANTLIHRHCITPCPA